MSRTWSTAAADPRVYQIAFLTAFLGFVLAVSEFSLGAWAMLAIFATALATQRLAVGALGIPNPGPLSPLISSLSLCLLLRTDSVAVAALAAAIAIGSKFVLRIGHKHIFNPTNLGLLATVLATDRAWISPGQWGSGLVLAFFVAALGLLVTRRVGRLDITLAFLGTHIGLQVMRMLYLGELPEVVLHRLCSGALIVFAFFMISDPRSTPDARLGRVLFAVLVAGVGYVLRFHYFIPSAPIWALLMVSPTTPAIDWLLRGERFEWRPKGVQHEMHRSAITVAPQ